MMNNSMGREKKSMKFQPEYVKFGAELEEQKEFLCLFFKFRSGPILYSLYAYVVAASDYIENPTPSSPTPPVTILKMPCHKDFPNGMACAKLDSRIYFVGGQCEFEDECYGSRKVYYLDVEKFRNRFSGARATTTSTTGLICCDELSQCPNMHGGKCNPTVTAANGKLYVLTGLIGGDPNNSTLGPPPHFNVTDWTSLFIDDSEWRRCAFEVYDPMTNEWTILPLPTSCPSPACIVPFHCYGHAVIHDKILFSYRGGTVSILDLKTLTWQFYYNGMIGKIRPPSYYDALALALEPNFLFGRGLVLDDTLYAFSSGHKNGFSAFYAYHIPENLEDTSVSWSSVELTSSYLLRPDSTSSFSALQAGFFYLGEGKFCSIYCENRFIESLSDDPLVPSDVYFVDFDVVKARSSSGDISWGMTRSSRSKIMGIDADLGSILDFFMLHM